MDSKAQEEKEEGSTARESAEMKVKLGLPGGLHAAAQRHANNARQRLERDRKERAAAAEAAAAPAEKEAAESEHVKVRAEEVAAEAAAKAAAKAAAEQERAQQATAERAKIPLGTAGGLAAAAAAARQQEVAAAAAAAADMANEAVTEATMQTAGAEPALPSAAESRQRLKDEQERQQLKEERRQLEREKQQLAAERAERQRAEVARQRQQQQAEQQRKREVEARDAARSKLGMTPSAVPPSLRATGLGLGDAAPPLTVDVNLSPGTPLRAPEAGGGGTPLLTPAGHFNGGTPSVVPREGAYGSWGGSPTASDHILHGTNLGTSFDNLAPFGEDSMPTKVGGALDDDTSSMLAALLQAWRDFQEKLCLPRVDGCLAFVDPFVTPISVVVLLCGVVALGWTLLFAGSTTSPPPPMTPQDYLQPSEYAPEDGTLSTDAYAGAASSHANETVATEGFSRPLNVEAAQRLANAAALGAASPQARTTMASTAEAALALFAPPRVGSLTGHNLMEVERVRHAAGCARRCVDFGPACVSFDFSASYQRCYLGSHRLDASVPERSATNSASEFLYYERMLVPMAGGSPALHPEAFALMKDAFDDLKRQAQRHNELIGSHVESLQSQRANAQSSSALDTHTSAVVALHNQVQRQSGELQSHSQNLQTVVETLHAHGGSAAGGGGGRVQPLCPHGYSGVGCLDLVASVLTPQHVLHLLRSAAPKAANMTLVIPPAVELQFKGAVIAFPPERIVGLFGTAPPTVGGTSSSVTGAHGLDVRGSLTEVRLGSMSFRGAKEGTFITVGDGATVSVVGCDLHGEVHFRYDGAVEVRDSYFVEARTFFAALQGDRSVGGGDGPLRPKLRIEDSEFDKGEVTINAPEDSTVTIVGLIFDSATIAMRTPPRTRSHDGSGGGPPSLQPAAGGTSGSSSGRSGRRGGGVIGKQVAVRAAGDSGTRHESFAMVSTQITHCRGTLGLAGTDVALSDTVVSNHTGPFVVCAPSYRGGGGVVLLHGLALVHNHALNVTHPEYLLDLSGCTSRGGVSAATMPRVAIARTTFLNNTVGVISADAASVAVEDSSFHGNSMLTAAAKTAKREVQPLATDAGGGLFAFSATLTIAASRFTAHRGCAACTPCTDELAPALACLVDTRTCRI
jgi:hypothetical protein